MGPFKLLGLIFSLLTVIRIKFLINLLINFSIIEIILFGSNYLLLFDANPDPIIDSYWLLLGPNNS